MTAANPGEDEEAAALERDRGPGELEPSPRREEPRSSFTHFPRLTQGSLPYQFSRPAPRAPSKTDPTPARPRPHTLAVTSCRSPALPVLPPPLPKLRAPHLGTGTRPRRRPRNPAKLQHHSPSSCCKYEFSAKEAGETWPGSPQPQSEGDVTLARRWKSPWFGSHSTVIRVILHPSLTLLPHPSSGMG